MFWLYPLQSQKENKMMKKDSCNTCALVFFCVLAFLIPICAVGQTNIGGANQTATISTPKLRIVIPVRNFTDFVTITKDPSTGEEIFGGFAIEIFKAVMDTALPNSPVPFQFIPFAKPDGSMNGTFDDMLMAVKNKNFDGAVGEITIRYARTQWVDFTLPYLDGSISMLVRLKLPTTKSSGISFRAVTRYVVASSLGFSFVVAIVFWILEYKNDKHASSADQSARNNDDQWRKEMLGSMVQTRLVTILFFMVLLVLIACYTASQTSSLGTQRRSGSVKNINQLIRMKLNVGYKEGSFIRDFLIQKGISESKLIVLKSREEMIDKLFKGTAQGGVDAVVADTTQLKLLSAEHCDSFTIPPTVIRYDDGFGFAFQKGSNLVEEISEGILKIIDNGLYARIRDRTIGSSDVCQDDPNSGDLLDPASLWILIAGAIAVFVLIFIVLLLYCGLRCNTRKKRVVAYPCYLWPCC